MSVHPGGDLHRQGSTYRPRLPRSSPVQRLSGVAHLTSRRRACGRSAARSTRFDARAGASRLFVSGLQFVTRTSLSTAPASRFRVGVHFGHEPLFDVSGKVVLVTGGTRGIGEMIARGFVDAGRECLHFLAQGRRLRRLAEELSGSAVHVPPGELSTEAECQRPRATK